jgi:hypothetical protein
MRPNGCASVANSREGIVRENIDLFGGDPHAIVVIGCLAVPHHRRPCNAARATSNVPCDDDLGATRGGDDHQMDSEARRRRHRRSMLIAPDARLRGRRKGGLLLIVHILLLVLLLSLVQFLNRAVDWLLDDIRARTRGIECLVVDAAALPLILAQRSPAGISHAHLLDWSQDRHDLLVRKTRSRPRPKHPS